MKAAILAAGLGTRLRPLTDLVPKTLMPVLNRPLLGLLLAQVEEAGFLQVAVNTHHLAGRVQQFLAGRPFGFNLSVSQEPELLGTGGGLKRLGEILGGGPFLAVNGDILTDLDLAAVYRSHRADAIATLVLHDCPPYNNVWLADGQVSGVGEPPPGGAAGPPLAYTGVQVVADGMLDYLPAGRPYDLVTAWRTGAGRRGEAVGFGAIRPFLAGPGHPGGLSDGPSAALAGGSPGIEPIFRAANRPLPGARGGHRTGSEVWRRRLSRGPGEDRAGRLLAPQRGLGRGQPRSGGGTGGLYRGLRGAGEPLRQS